MRGVYSSLFSAYDRINGHGLGAKNSLQYARFITTEQSYLTTSFCGGSEGRGGGESAFVMTMDDRERGGRRSREIMTFHDIQLFSICFLDDG